MNKDDALHEMTARELLHTERRMFRKYLDAWSEYSDYVIEGKEEEAVQFAEKWAKEHPEKKRKTYAEDLLSHYPKAQVSEDGVPFFCRKHIVDKPLHCTQYNYNCTACWNEEMGGEDE